MIGVIDTNQVISMNWHPAQVKAALEMKGTNLSRLVEQHGYAHINEVLTRPWLAAERIVAQALGVAPESIWPSRYERSRNRAVALTRKPGRLARPEARGQAEDI